MEPDPVTAGFSHSGKSQQFNTANLFAIVAMGVGSIGYGYSANVIAPILGMFKLNGMADSLGR